MPHWKITRYDGAEVVWTKPVSGRPSEKQIVTMLQRLVCMNLSANEIIGASLRANAKQRNSLLDCDRNDKPISLGECPHYVANFVSE